ncbi:MAG: LPS O-antigen length regulator [Pseudomonadales bacterium]|nr:LPS O-antigen length regulator [Pseudomonadales bacterium]
MESNPISNNRAYDEINLWEIFSLLFSNKWQIIGITSAFAILSITYSLSVTEIYRAESLLAPAEFRQTNNPLINQLGPAAGLIGVEVGSGVEDKVSTSIAILESREFIRDFIERHNILVPLMAGRWSNQERRNIIDSTVYNELEDEWQIDTPTDWDAYRVYSEILSVSENRESGMITISIEWHDPEQAQLWVNLMVEEINKIMKERDLEEANSAISYLQNQIGTTQLVEMQRVFYDLINSQMRVVMLADVRDDYIFRVIDPAVIPQDKIRPRRALICVVGTLIGGLLAVLIVLVRSAISDRRTVKIKTE